MADLPEQDEWVAGIYQLETSDPVLGGPEGIDNLQAKQLGNRTRWLRNQFQRLIDGVSSAGIAKRLEQARMLRFKGAATGSAQFDGSADVEIPLVLADSGVAAGSYSKVTLNVKGIVTSGSNPTTLAGYGILDALPKGAGGLMTTPAIVARLTDLDATQFIAVDSNTTDRPGNLTYGAGVHVELPGNNYAFELLGNVMEDWVGFRHVSSTGSGDWRALWHDGNFNPSLKANLANPAFTGVPTVPDAAEGSSSAQAANTKFVSAAAAKKFDKTGGVVSGRIVVDAPTQTETLAGLIIQNPNVGGWSGIALTNPNGSGNLRYSNSTNTLYLRNHITDFAHLDVGDLLSNSYKVHTTRSFMMPSAGQWTAISGQVALPAGGTWAYVVSEHNLGGVPQPNRAEVVAGGTVVGGAGAWGFAWRIF